MVAGLGYSDKPSVPLIQKTYTVGLQRYEHQGKLGVRNCEIFVSLKFDNIDDCKTCENKSKHGNCESVRMNSRVTKITIHRLLFQGRTPFLSCKVQELSQKHEIHRGGFSNVIFRRSRSSLKSTRFIGVDFPMLYSEGPGALSKA